MDEQKIKDNLKAKRKAKGFSQQKMADEMDIDRNTYIKLENGSTHMLSPRLYEAAGVLGCRLEDLLEENAEEDGKAVSYYGTKGQIKENCLFLRDELEKAEEENRRLRDEIKELREENAALIEKTANLEELYSLQKEVADFLKAKIAQLENPSGGKGN